MAQPKATYEAVAAAIEQLKTEGRSITVAAIQAITGGSNSTIVLLKRRYEAERPTVLAAMTIEVDPQINALIAADKQRAVDKAGAEAARKIAELENDLTRDAEESEERRALLESREAELEATKGQLQSLAGQIDQLKTDADAIKSEAASQIRAAEERAAQAVAKAEAEATRESKEREAAQMALAKAELRLEALPRLEKEIERLQAALDTERTARTSAEQAAAVANTKAEGLAARLADAQEQHKAALTNLAEQAKEQKQRAGETILKIETRLAELEKAKAAADELAKAKADELAKAKTEAAELRGKLAALENQPKEGKK